MIARTGTLDVSVWRLLLAGVALVAADASLNRPAQRTVHPGSMPGLLAFWDLQENAGEDRVSKEGRFRYSLHEGNGLMRRSGQGLFGSHSAYVERGQWFIAERKSVPGLTFHGRQSFTMMAWLKRMRKADRKNCDFVAGMWDETAKARQYALFINLDRGSIATGNQGADAYGYGDQVNGHISNVGGPTPGYPYATMASFGRSRVVFNKWQTVGTTYDGSFIRSYLNGRFEGRPKLNPFAAAEGIYDGGLGGSNFYIGANPVPYPGFAENGFNGFYKGLIGGLAIYDRALSDSEMALLSDNLQ